MEEEEEDVNFDSVHSLETVSDSSKAKTSAKQLRSDDPLACIFCYLATANWLEKYQNNNSYSSGLLLTAGDRSKKRGNLNIGIHEPQNQNSRCGVIVC